jgi:hypothetical protein
VYSIKFSKNHTKMLLADFTVEVGKEDILYLQLGMKVYMKLVMITVIVVVNFATSKNPTVKSITFLHRNIHKYAWKSPEGENPQ